MAIADIMQQFKNMTARQKTTVVIFVVIVIIVLWQIIGLFGGGEHTAPVPPIKPVMTAAGPAGAAAPGTAPGAMVPTPQQMRPQPAQLQKQPAMSQREMELMKLQQETQAKYLSALNELQMLKVERELAETNQAIATAKLATITAQKNIIDLLNPPAPTITPETYAKGLVGPAAAGGARGMPQPGPEQGATAPAQPAEVNYTVISVSQLQYRWSAVLGYQGNLYNVTMGDVLPPDGSKVVSIDRSGVTLEKNGEKKKISLVPII